MTDEEWLNKVTAQCVAIKKLVDEINAELTARQEQIKKEDEEYAKEYEARFSKLNMGDII